MGRTLLTNVKLATPNALVENIGLEIADGTIVRLVEERGTAAEEIDLNGAILYPGFIDCHIHGAIGVDTNAANAGDLRGMAAYLASQGTTAWLPTLVPDSDENYRRTVKELDSFMDEQHDQPVAQSVGIHYEGVFANEAMCGALHSEFFKKFTGSEIGELPRLRKGVHFTTLAPEIEGGVALVRELVRQGWIVSIGHTKSDMETLNSAFEAGAGHLTHFYNAMTGLHHRDVGVVGWAFSKDEVTFDIIADGIHVHPDMLRFACLSKTPDKVSLISDAVLPTGLGDGDYEIWGEKVSVENGRTRNGRGSIAGSVITMVDAVRRMLSLGFSPVEAAKMASLNPAKLIGIDKTHGSIEAGKRADLVALDGDGNIVMAMVGGRVV